MLHTTISPETAGTVALTATGHPIPCRFCGEAEKLVVDESGYNDQFSYDQHMQVVRGPTGEALLGNDASVWCRVCDVMAPATVWNASPEDGARMRAATLAVWPEYSDEDGSWMGVAQ